MLLPVVAGGIGLLLQGRLRGEAHRVIAAVYRAAIREAREFGATGLVWLVSPEGVAFRKDLAERAYDALPPRIGAFPVGVIKAFVSRDRFVELVELSFAEVVELADKLEEACLLSWSLLPSQTQRDPLPGSTSQVGAFFVAHQRICQSTSPCAAASSSSLAVSWPMRNFNRSAVLPSVATITSSPRLI